MENKTTDIALLQSEINKQVSNPTVLNSLMEITFKGLKPEVAKRAMLEAMMRKFTFQDFLDKNVYAIPFGTGYSLVNSIDYNRKVGMKGGVCGVGEPIYVDDSEGNIISCSITIKKAVGSTIGDFTAKVYFKEYYIGNKNPDGSIKKNQWGEVKPSLWDTKPRTMIAKVAEMQALRKACPEELSQSYIEEEYEKEVSIVKEIKDIEEGKKELKEEDYKNNLLSAKSLLELRNVWVDIPGIFKTPDIIATKNSLIKKFEAQNETKNI